MKNWLRVFFRALIINLLSSLEMLKILSAGPNMATGKLFKLYLDEKLGMGVLRALFTNLLSTFENFKSPKSWIQSAHRKTFLPDEKLNKSILGR